MGIMHTLTSLSPLIRKKGQFVRKSRRGEKGGKKKTDEAEEMGQKAQHASTVKGGGGGVGVRGD